MRTSPLLAFVFLFALHAVSQDAPRVRGAAQCKFSSGNTIKITYSSNQPMGTARLVADEDLVSVKGINIPAGDYKIFLTKDVLNGWRFNMRKGIATGKSLPLSVTPPTVPIKTFNISFDQTGGSCVMRWAFSDAQVFLLEFTEKNADLPIEP